MTTFKYYLVADSASGGKFWELEVEGCDVRIRFGKLGQQKDWKTHTFATKDEAFKDGKKRLLSKMKKGYKSASRPMRDQLDDVSNGELMQAMRAATQCDVLLRGAGAASYEFHERWSGEFSLATYDNGGGDNLVVLELGDMLVIKGFDHESPVSPHARDPYGVWPGMYEGLPGSLKTGLEGIENTGSPADHVTFCFWRTSDGKLSQGPVKLGKVDDGSGWLAQMIMLNADDYIEWANDYFEGLTEEQKVKIQAIFG